MPRQRDLIVRTYSIPEDVYGLGVAALLVSVGMSILDSAQLVTGGTVGIALLASFTVPLGYSTILVLLNVPFLLIGLKMMGRTFVLKSCALAVAIFALGQWITATVAFAAIPPGFAALAGGTIAGMGALAAARHGAGAGGTLVVVLALQKRLGLNAGAIQLTIDAAILLASIYVLPFDSIFWSAVSVVALDTMVIVWHRPAITKAA